MGNAVPRGGGRRQTPQHAAQKVARKPDKGGRGQDALNKLPTGEWGEDGAGSGRTSFCFQSPPNANVFFVC